MKSVDEQLLQMLANEERIRVNGPGSDYYPPNFAPPHRYCYNKHKPGQTYHTWVDEGLVWGCKP